ncbi:1-acyl-sn-glycerol-3-phosphate acyltransferase, partial [Pseudoalteromonas issachenkonii]
QFASIWVTFNSLNQKLFTPSKLNVSGLEELKLKDWYLVIANHQSWVDIFVLQRVFNRIIRFLNFFFKKELI